uniref:KASH domain-containing protein n=1 Tax=Elaeophora elaphi TaxID=1147741 RepID=A0A0R3RIJ3_9BILA
MQNDLISRLNKLNDDAIMVRNTSCDETQTPRLEELKNELGKLADMMEEIKQKESKPMKLVATFRFAYITLQSTITNEAQELRCMMNEAYKVESDVNATTSDLQKAVDDLKNGRSHLAALQDAYDKLGRMPNATDSLYEKAFDEISMLNEQYDNVERNLEDRLDMLNEFDAIADSVNKQLIDLENNVHRLEVPSASCELSVADKGFNDTNELRESLKKLSELKEQLTPLLKPTSVVEDFDNRLSDVNKNFQQWHDEIVKKKQELEAENNLSNLINDFKQILINAENDYEKLEVTMDALKNFRDITLPMVVEKSDRIRDLILPVKTENIEQLYHDMDVLTDRYNDLSTRVNDKLNYAKEQENLFDEIQRELNDIEQKADDFLDKYITSQDLSIATEDVNQLRSLLDQIPSSAMENITERGFKDNLVKKADGIKNKIKNLLIPLEKDIRKEQELLNDLYEILSTLTAIGDDVIAVDPIMEPSQQLESIGQLAENLRKLKGKVEKLEGKLQNTEGMVKRALVTDDLFGRVVQLQDALDDKKGKLTERAKLYAITPEINLINESVQNYVNDMEQKPMQTVEEQNAALSELEGKKHQLENLLGNIPQGDEGNELREKGNWLMEQLNDMLKRLAAAVGDKLAALATFNAMKDEVETQLSSLQAKRALISDEITTVCELDNQLHDIKVKIEKLEKLKEKVSHANVSGLDKEQCDKRNALLSIIDGLLLCAQNDHAYLDEKRTQLLTHEKICTNCKALYDELENLVKDGRELLNNPDALPASYGSTSDSLTTLIDTAVNSRINEPEIEQSNELIFEQLWELIDKAKDVQSQLIQRVYMWEQFVKERDSAVEELNDICRQIDEIEERGMRRFDKMLDDLEALKVLYLRWSFLANLSSRLLSLSSQLHPLVCAQREGKTFAEETSELEKKIENLLDSMSAEFRVREEILHSLRVISDELDDIKNVLDDQNISARLQKDLQQQLEGIRAHLNTLNEDITKYSNNRIFLSEEEEISTRRNFERLEEIEEKLKQVELADAEEEYDIDAAAEVLAAVYPDDHPRDVLRKQGIPFDDDSYDLTPSSATSDDDDKSKFKTPPDDEIILEGSETEDAIEAHQSNDVIALSPVPDDPSPGRVHYERQRSRWRRILRTALPLQAMLVLLLGAACLVPHCDDESCCQLLNNFARSFDPTLEFLNGPPPF